jgi:thiol-disulfide isomerase/thioredoxin
MNRKSILAIGLLVVLVAFVVVARGFSGVAERFYGVSPRMESDSLVIASDSPTAPDFASGTWINSDPLTLKGLRGRVVLVEFWTFGCYNCRNTLPAVKRWHGRYSEKGLTIVGVHSPEFDSEKKIENLRRQVASLGIRFPVVTDNEYETWRAYNVGAWPTIFVLDKSGRIRWTHVGEGRYDETEHVIQKLLAEPVRASNSKSS